MKVLIVDDEDGRIHRQVAIVAAHLANDIIIVSDTKQVQEEIRQHEIQKQRPMVLGLAALGVDIPDVNIILNIQTMYNIHRRFAVILLNMGILTHIGWIFGLTWFDCIEDTHHGYNITEINRRFPSINRQNRVGQMNVALTKLLAKS